MRCDHQRSSSAKNITTTLTLTFVVSNPPASTETPTHENGKRKNPARRCFSSRASLFGCDIGRTPFFQQRTPTSFALSVSVWSRQSGTISYLIPFQSFTVSSVLSRKQQASRFQSCRADAKTVIQTISACVAAPTRTRLRGATIARLVPMEPKH